MFALLCFVDLYRRIVLLDPLVLVLYLDVLRLHAVRIPSVLPTVQELSAVGFVCLQTVLVCSFYQDCWEGRSLL